MSEKKREHYIRRLEEILKSDLVKITHEAYFTEGAIKDLLELLKEEPERLTDDDFETIRIHLNAYKEKLCNQQRWEEAEEYKRIIDRFMAFVSAEPERKKGKWIPYSKVYECRYECSSCGYHLIGIHESEANFCPNCGADMGG